MSKKMLIEATHPEETRVVVLEDSRLDELDVETSTKKQIKGNIYLAKVVRVEPSLQAAFVEYGGNRHGFLAFNEIHPDYYQIPAADLEKLKKEMQQEADRAEEAEEVAGKKSSKANADDVETISDSDNDENLYRPRRMSFRKYRIQEVIHHGQKMLVQVTKEERGNKGAAMTTYLSLAGRYSVLMPKNGSSGGVSRKIANIADRKRLKKIVEDLPLREGQSVIIRTAGKDRTKAEIKRDFEYLDKTWEDIVEKTMESIAPALIHEEANLIKRTLRDTLTDDIDEIIIEGEEAYKNAKAFLKLLMPRQVKKIKEYKKDIPLFQAYNIENQLEEMNQKNVYLKSGGYLVIDQAEALVAIDVNSGRATRERNIEETALKTNLEAADEVARQLRLRDLAGLVVIDFIDMEEPKNNYAVERRMREALKKDRARVQMGKITGFGLMEISRQRLRSSLQETGHHVCPMCQGCGIVRSDQSSAMHALHTLEEAAAEHTNSRILMTLPLDIALYVLNNKRETLAQIEARHDVAISIQADNTMICPTDFRMEYEALPMKDKKSFFARTIETLLPFVAEEKAAEKAAVKAQEKPSKKDKKPEKAKPQQAQSKEAMSEPVASQGKNKKRNKPQKKQKDEKNATNATEEKFKVVRQEAITAYDAHSTSVIEKHETPVVAVAPAITEVEAVAKPKSQKRSKKSRGDKSLQKQRNNQANAPAASEAHANEPVLAPKEDVQEQPVQSASAHENGAFQAQEAEMAEKTAKVEVGDAVEPKASQHVEEHAAAPEVIILEDKSQAFEDKADAMAMAEQPQAFAAKPVEMPVVENPKKGWWNKAQE